MRGRTLLGLQKQKLAVMVCRRTHRSTKRLSSCWCSLQSACFGLRMSFRWWVQFNRRRRNWKVHSSRQRRRERAAEEELPQKRQSRWWLLHLRACTVQLGIWILWQRKNMITAIKYGPTTQHQGNPHGLRTKSLWDQSQALDSNVLKFCNLLPQMIVNQEISTKILMFNARANRRISMYSRLQITTWKTPTTRLRLSSKPEREWQSPILEATSSN